MRVDAQLLILCLERRILRFDTFTTASTRRKLILPKRILELPIYESQEVFE
jgi:hypothetical protein